MYVKHPNKHNDQEFNVKAILQKKDSNPCQTWSDLINIYKFDNAITFKLRSLLCFGTYRADQLKRFAPFSYLNHSFILSLNVKVCIRFTVFLQISLCFFICQELCWSYDESYVAFTHIFMFFVSSWRGEQKV